MTKEQAAQRMSETIAKSRIVSGKRPGSDVAEVLVNPADVWKASGERLEILIQWYCLAVLRLRETIPEDFIDGLVGPLPEATRNVQRSALLDFNKGIEFLRLKDNRDDSIPDPQEVRQ